MPTRRPSASERRNGFATSNTRHLYHAPRPVGYPSGAVRVVSNSSSLVLERELLDRVAAAKSGDPLAPVLIVVPSARLADHVARRLVERFGAVLGVEIVH